MVAEPETDPASEDLIRQLTECAHPPLVPEIKLRLATPACPLWSATARDLGRMKLRDPFWAFCWPGGQALARFLLDEPRLVSGRRVLAFGAGGGVEAIAAAMAGAALVQASDEDPLAVACCLQNAASNGVRLQAKAESILGTRLDEWDVVLAADVCYEADLAERVTGWLLLEASEGREVLLSDPARGYFDPRGWRRLAELRAPADTDVEGRHWVRTGIYSAGPASNSGRSVY